MIIVINYYYCYYITPNLEHLFIEVDFVACLFKLVVKWSLLILGVSNQGFMGKEKECIKDVVLNSRHEII